MVMLIMLLFFDEYFKAISFPEIEDEKFVPEGFMWAQITSSYKMKYIDEIIYFVNTEMMVIPKILKTLKQT